MQTSCTLLHISFISHYKKISLGKSVQLLSTLLITSFDFLCLSYFHFIILIATFILFFPLRQLLNLNMFLIKIKVEGGQ